MIKLRRGEERRAKGWDWPLEEVGRVLPWHAARVDRLLFTRVTYSCLSTIGYDKKMAKTHAFDPTTAHCYTRFAISTASCLLYIAIVCGTEKWERGVSKSWKNKQRGVGIRVMQHHQ